MQLVREGLHLPTWSQPRRDHLDSKGAAERRSQIIEAAESEIPESVRPIVDYSWARLRSLVHRMLNDVSNGLFNEVRGQDGAWLVRNADLLRVMVYSREQLIEEFQIAHLRDWIRAVKGDHQDFSSEPLIESIIARHSKSLADRRASVLGDLSADLHDRHGIYPATMPLAPSRILRNFWLATSCMDVSKTERMAALGIFHMNANQYLLSVWSDILTFTRGRGSH